MEVRQINSYEDLKNQLEGGKRTYLLLYKAGAEKSDCAYSNLTQAAGKVSKPVTLLAADVNRVRDIHEQYGITTAPAILEFKGDDFVKSVKGCQSHEYYVSLLENNLYVSQQQEEQPRKRVIVYSTPTCPHCNNLKNYLRKNQIQFRDVDVSKDQKMAQELVRKSGQQGVPQAEINGRIIVGFNKPKIDELLGIQG